MRNEKREEVGIRGWIRSYEVKEEKTRYTRVPASFTDAPLSIISIVQ